MFKKEDLNLNDDEYEKLLKILLTGTVSLIGLCILASVLIRKSMAKEEKIMMNLINELKEAKKSGDPERFKEAKEKYYKFIGLDD